MRRIRTSEWVTAAFAIGLILAGAAVAVAPPAHKLGMALRATARWSFLCFCLATYGGALATLLGARFLGLARHGRDFGLAYAAALLVHVALASRAVYLSPGPFPRLPLAVFSVGVFWTYLLALLSLSTPISAWLGTQNSKVLRTIGVEYLAFAYAFEFGGRILDGNRTNALHYLPLFAFAVGGPVLRVCAGIVRRNRMSHATGIVPG